MLSARFVVVRRKYTSKFIVGLIVSLLFGASSTIAQNAVVSGQINATGIVSVSATPIAGGPVQLRTSDGGKYSLHAGAQLDGAAAPNPEVKHRPGAGQPAEANILPVDIANPNAPLKDQRAVPVPLKNGKKYADNPNNPDKNFTSPPQQRDVSTSGAATKMVTTAANPPAFPMALNTIATAEAKVFFEEDPAKIYKVSAENSVVKLTGPLQFGEPFTNVRRGPSGRASMLVLDPLTYGNVQPGDVLRGRIDFEEEFFQAQVNDPLGLVTMINEVGTDLLGLSPGPLGTSFENGLPLIFRLRVTLVSDSAPLIEFEYNPAFTFFDPDDPTETMLADPVALVLSRFSAALDPLAMPGDLYTLTGDVHLLAFKATATQAISRLSVDYLSGQIAITSVPEPSTLLLFGITAAITLRYRRGAKNRRPDRFASHAVR